MTQESIDHIIGVVMEKGSDAWYQMPVEALLPESLQDQAHLLDKGQDTMDVWWVARCGRAQLWMICRGCWRL